MNSIGQLSLDSETASSMMPELIMLLGLIAIVVIPNLGDAKFRLPLTSVRVPVLLGGSRFELTNDPRMPNRISNLTFSLALLSSLLLISESPSEVGGILVVDSFSRLFSTMFLAALLLVSIATTHRLPAKTNAHIPKESDSESVFDRKISILIDNRRQVDFYILLIMVGLGMTMMTMATNLFMLIVCIELASLSTYVLVAFHKEDGTGGEAGAKYFIVGSVASAIGIYGMSLLYLWQGDLSVSGLAQSWQSMETIDPLAAAGVGMMIVAFGFKVGAAPFHLAIPDAYSGTSSMVAGVLATASKAMGFVALMRLLLTIAMPATGSAFWYGALAVISVVTMTWGNLAALSSDNPKRVLAYSSVAHAGYMLAAVSAIGSGLADGPASEMIVVAVLFHLCVLVLFKMGPFMVLSAIEREGGSHRVAGLNGLASRDPLLAASMFVFMLSLAGVPPFSGFLSKLLMLNGIVTVSAGTGGAESLLSWATSVDPTFWLAVAIVLNSALSIFYYLRMGMVMFFEPNEAGEGSPCNTAIRTLIVSLAVLSLAFGIGPPSEWLLGLAEDAAAALLA